jgi:hypothetical protein
MARVGELSLYILAFWLFKFHNLKIIFNFLEIYDRSYPFILTLLSLLFIIYIRDKCGCQWQNTNAPISDALRDYYY